MARLLPTRLAVLAWVASRQPLGTMARLLPTRLAVLAIAIGVAFVLDYAAAVLADPVPSPLILRRLIRSLSATVAASALALFALLVASDGMDLVRVISSDEAQVEVVDPETFDDSPNSPSTPPKGGVEVHSEYDLGLIQAPQSRFHHRRCAPVVPPRA